MNNIPKRQGDFGDLSLLPVIVGFANHAGQAVLVVEVAHGPQQLSAVVGANGLDIVWNVAEQQNEVIA